MSLFDKIKNILTPGVVGEIVQDSDSIKRDLLIKEFDAKLQEYKNLSEGKVGTYDEHVDPETGAKVTVLYTEYGPLVKKEMSGLISKDAEGNIVDGSAESYTGIMYVRDGVLGHDPELRYFDNATIGKSNILDNPELGFSRLHFIFGTSLTQNGDLTDLTTSENRSIDYIDPIGGNYDLMTNVKCVFSALKENYKNIDKFYEMERE